MAQTRIPFQKSLSCLSAYKTASIMHPHVNHNITCEKSIEAIMATIIWLDKPLHVLSWYDGTSTLRPYDCNLVHFRRKFINCHNIPSQFYYKTFEKEKKYFIFCNPMSFQLFLPEFLNTAKELFQIRTINNWDMRHNHWFCLACLLLSLTSRWFFTFGLIES